MKQYFTILIGGLLMIGATFFTIKGLVIFSAYTKEHPLKISIKIPTISSLTSAVIKAPTDGTVISGMTRSIRFTALDEEDVIAAAENSLPKSKDDKITARAYLVKDLSSGEVATVFNANKLMPIASLTKLVTAITARRLIDNDEKITLTPSIIATYGNTAGFKKGETFTSGDLLYPLLMVSSNDAAEAFAQHYGRARFISAMNSFAQSIGAYRTYFDDPSGLSANNVSTVTDMSLILDWIRENDPYILSITDTKTKIVRSHTFVNPTHFLNWSNYIGGKNGYTPEANRTGAAIFSVGKNGPYSVIVLGSDSRDNDVIKLLAKIGK